MSVIWLMTRKITIFVVVVLTNRMMCFCTCQANKIYTSFFNFITCANSRISRCFFLVRTDLSLLFASFSSFSLSLSPSFASFYLLCVCVVHLPRTNPPLPALLCRYTLTLVSRCWSLLSKATMPACSLTGRLALERRTL